MLRPDTGEGTIAGGGEATDSCARAAKREKCDELTASDQRARQMPVSVLTTPYAATCS